MDKVAHYRDIIVKVLTDYVAARTDDADVHTQLLLDKERHHYQVMRVGWKDRRRVYYIVFHFDIINEKIHAQHNASDYDIIGDVEAMGVPKEDIVLAFHSPAMQPYTGYAVA